MAFADRTPIARTDGRDAFRAGELMAGALVVALTAILAIRQLVPAEAVVPATVTLMFAASAVTAGLALLCRTDRLRTMWFDLAGGLTFIGVAISVLIEPDQLASLFGVSNQPE